MPSVLWAFGASLLVAGIYLVIRLIQLVAIMRQERTVIREERTRRLQEGHARREEHEAAAKRQRETESFRRHVWRKFCLDEGYDYRDPQMPSGTPAIRFQVQATEDLFQLTVPLQLGGAFCTGQRADGTDCSPEIALWAKATNSNTGAKDDCYYCGQCDTRLSQLDPQTIKAWATTQLNRDIVSLRKRWERKEYLIEG